MPDDFDDQRVLTVIEFLANLEQIGSKTVKIRGRLAGSSENSCVVTDEDGRGRGFDAGDLPEQDRIRLLQSGFNGKPFEHGVVTLDCSTNRAKHVDFES